MARNMNVTIGGSHDSRILIRLEARLARYALAAGAALAAGKPAAAGVVTTVLPTPVNLLSTHPYNTDLNGDTVTDFVFFTGATVFSTLGLNILGLTGGGFPFLLPLFGGHGGSTSVAFRFSIGDVIGVSGSNFPGNGSAQSLTLDDFTAPGHGFVGVDLVTETSSTSSERFHNYGFYELENTSLVGWAYETTVDTPITAFDLNATVPEPNSLALLAIGAAALATVRKMKNRV